MSTLTRVIKKKLGLNYPIDLRLTGNSDKLSITGTADQAGLKDGMTLFASRAQEEPSAESAEETATIRIQRNDKSKMWTTTLPLSASTTHLYHEFAQITHQTPGHFYFFRSNGTRVGRFLTIADLHLRKNEVLFYSAQVPTLVEAHWLDSIQKEHQRKQTFISEDETLDSLRPILREEFQLDFNFEVSIDDPWGTDPIKDYTNDAGILVVYLARYGKNWDDKNFTPLPITREVMTLTTNTSNVRNISMEVFPGSTVADFAQMVYTQEPELQSRVFEDIHGLPYELTDLLEHIVPCSGIMALRVNAVLEYSAEQANHAVQTIAALRALTPDAVATGSLSSLAK
jgi:hypothetical protein